MRDIYFPNTVVNMSGDFGLTSEQQYRMFENYDAGCGQNHVKLVLNNSIALFYNAGCANIH
jgi:hypothetical protein